MFIEAFDDGRVDFGLVPGTRNKGKSRFGHVE